MRRLGKQRFAPVALLLGAVLLAFASPSLMASLSAGLAGLIPPLAQPAPAFTPVHLPLSQSGSGRTLTLNQIQTAPGAAKDQAAVKLSLAVSNQSEASFSLTPQEFFLTARGDFFGTPAGSAGGPAGAVLPGTLIAGRLLFQVPAAALPDLALVYRPTDAGTMLSLPLSATSAAAASLSGAWNIDTTLVAATSTNTIEDNFVRANQTGWGVSTNASGLPNVTWGMDGNGAVAFQTIAGNSRIAYSLPVRCTS
jgi:hypothetical protein